MERRQTDQHLIFWQQHDIGVRDKQGAGSADGVPAVEHNQYPPCPSSQRFVRVRVSVGESLGDAVVVQLEVVGQANGAPDPGGARGARLSAGGGRPVVVGLQGHQDHCLQVQQGTGRSGA